MLTFHKMAAPARMLAALIVFAVVALILAATPVVPAQAATTATPDISTPAAFGAPTKARGGIMNPYVWCSNYSVEPRVKWVLTNNDSGYSRTFTWKGALPGLYFPRVKVGTYRSTTTAWCKDNKARRVSTVTVWQKTAKNTMSKPEFRRIKKGMTPDQVRRIVGYSGSDSGSYNGEKMRAYDIMPFWRWTIVVYKNGKVIRKDWNVDHD